MARRIVFSASGRTAVMPYFALICALLSKIDGHGSDQSMISAALTHGLSFPLLTSALSLGACVGCGQTMGLSSHRATRKNRFRVVGAPKSAATSSFHSTS